MRTPENKHSVKRVGLAIAVGFGITGGGVLVGKTLIDSMSKSSAVAAQPTEIPSPTAQPTLRPITPTEAAVIATATRASSSTATPPEATVTNTPTIVPATATSTATETPKSPENPLPKYGVFFGNVTDPTTGAKLAEMVMASIPQTGGNDEVFVYWISSKDQMGGRSRQGMQLKPLNTNATHFELGWMPRGGKPTDFQRYFTGDYDPQAKIISGDTTRPYLNGNHTLKYVGEGKAVVFRTIGQIITDQSSDQPINVQQDLAKFKITVDLWP